VVQVIAVEGREKRPGVKDRDRTHRDRSSPRTPS
jgi:hypothetical protein